MKNKYYSKNLYTGKLNSTYENGDIQELCCKDGTVNYIFEKRKNEYYEIFTDKLLKTEENCRHNNCFTSSIGQLYISEIQPISNLIKNINYIIKKESILYMFDYIN